MFRDLDALEIDAAKEGAFFEGGDTIGDCYGVKSFALLECEFADFFQSGGQLDLIQSVATIKGVFVNFFHTIGHRVNAK